MMTNISATIFIMYPKPNWAHTFIRTKCIRHTGATVSLFNNMNTQKTKNSTFFVAVLLLLLLWRLRLLLCQNEEGIQGKQTTTWNSLWCIVSSMFFFCSFRFRVEGINTPIFNDAFNFWWTHWHKLQTKNTKRTFFSLDSLKIVAVLKLLHSNSNSFIEILRHSNSPYSKRNFTSEANGLKPLDWMLKF